jgi:hypothetical protein
MAKLFTVQGLGLVVAAVLSCAPASALWAAESPSDLPIPSPEPRPGGRDVPFVEIEARASGRPWGELRRVITSPGEYQALVGRPPPAGLDFQREWVVLYAAGTMPTGGYEARVTRIRRSGGDRIVTVETTLVTPGPHCFVTQALTNPYVLVRFPRGMTAQRVRFVHGTEVRDCLDSPGIR